MIPDRIIRFQNMGLGKGADTSALYSNIDVGRIWRMVGLALSLHPLSVCFFGASARTYLNLSRDYTNVGSTDLRCCKR